MSAKKPTHTAAATDATERLSEENYRLQERLDKLLTLQLATDVLSHGDHVSNNLFEMSLSLPLLPDMWLLVNTSGANTVLIRVSENENLLFADNDSSTEIVMYIMATVLAHYARHATYHGEKITRLLQYIRPPAPNRNRW